jgi:hypothetical protein
MAAMTTEIRIAGWRGRRKRIGEIARKKLRLKELGFAVARMIRTEGPERE